MSIVSFSSRIVASLFLLPLLLSSDLLAQQYQVTHYTKDKGLPGNQVWSIYQDRKGYMWFSTSVSLVKYNGKKFSLYNKTSGLVDDFSLNVAEDTLGNIWVGCPGGVSKISKGGTRNWRLGSFDSFYRVFVDSRQRVWVYDFQFPTDVYVIENDSIQNFSREYGLRNHRVLCVQEDRNGSVYFLNNADELYRFDGSKIVRTVPAQIARDVAARMFFFDSADNLVICGNNGAARLVHERGKAAASLDWLLREPTMYGLASRDGYYWFATRNKGLARVSSHIGTGSERRDILWITRDNGLTTNSLFTLFQDREDNLWIGTDLKGVCKLSSLRFVAFGRPEGFQRDAILAMASHQGTLYCAADRGLYKFRDNRFEKISLGEQGKRISRERFFLNLLRVEHGWYLGSAPGLFFLDDAGSLELRGLDQVIVQTLFQDADGNVWVGTNKGLYEIRGRDNPIYRDFGLRRRFVSKLMTVNGSDLNVATDSGVAIVKNAVGLDQPSETRFLTTSQGLSSNMITDIVLSPDGDVLIGSSEGLSVLSNGSIYNVSEGFLNKYVVALHVDRMGDLWAGTDNGLHRLRKIQERFVIIGTYLHRDGLISNEFTRNSTILDGEEGRVWFGTYAGLTSYNPAEEPRSPVPPLGYLSFLQVNDSVLIELDGRPIELNPSENKLRFLFEGLSFLNEDAVQFQYYLEPREKPWSNTTIAPSVSYQYLESGSFTFHVRAVSVLGVASEPRSQTVRVLAPLWIRPWFIVLGSGFLLVVGYLVNIYRLSRSRQRNVILQRLVAEKTAELRESKTRIEEQYLQLVEAQKELVEKAKLEVAYEEIQKLKNKLARENIYLREKQTTVSEASSVIGKSAAISQIRYQIEEVANSDLTVLITGETGTGKNLVAEAIHALSPRKDRALVTVNCAAIPESLVESELFGHERGAFTGANERRLGKFEIADGSSIFLDEIGDMNISVQAKVLNVLQERRFERIGGNQPIRVDVRLIAATNYDIEELVRGGRFRTDLYYRLNVFRIHVPPLRERPEDIEGLTKYFVEKFSKSRAFGREITAITKAALDNLGRYSFPGNVRELENIVQRGMIICRGDVLTEDEIILQPFTRGVKGAGSHLERMDFQTLEEVEKYHIRQILEKTSWQIQGKEGAATILGIHPNTLRSRMTKLGIPFRRD